MSYVPKIVLCLQLLVTAALATIVTKSATAQPNIYAFQYRPFDGEKWVYVRREVGNRNLAETDADLDFKGRQFSYRGSRLATIYTRSKRIDISRDDWHQRAEGQTYQPYSPTGALQKGEYELIAHNGRQMFLRDGQRVEDEDVQTVRGWLETPWDWENLAKYLNGTHWQVNESRSVEPGPASFLTLNSSATLTLSSVGERWGRTVATFRLEQSLPNQPAPTVRKIWHIDRNTLRPLVTLETIRSRGEREDAHGNRLSETLHQRIERTFAFPDQPKFINPVRNATYTFARQGDEKRTPIDIGMSGDGDTLLILEKLHSSSAINGQYRLGTWNIPARRPVDLTALTGGDLPNLNATRASDTVSVQDGFTVQSYAVNQSIVNPMFGYLSGLDAPKIRASLSLSRLDLIGKADGVIEVGHFGWRAKYAEKQVSSKAIQTLSAGNDTSVFFSVDADGHIRKHSLSVAETSPCQLPDGADWQHCDGLRIDLSASQPLGQIESEYCVAEMSDTLNVSPNGRWLAWSSYAANANGGCDVEGVSWLLDTSVGSTPPKRVMGAGLAFIDDRSLITSEGIAPVSSPNAFQSFQLASPLRSPLTRRTHKIVVSDRHKSAYLLAKQSGTAFAIYEIDLASCILQLLDPATPYSAPRAVGLDGDQHMLFTLTESGHILEEDFNSGEVFADARPQKLMQDVGLISVRDAHILQDEERAIAISSFGLTHVMAGLTSSNSAPSALSEALPGVYGSQFSDTSHSTAEGSALLGAGWAIVTHRDLRGGGAAIELPLINDISLQQTIRLSGSGPSLRIVIGQVAYTTDWKPTLFVYKIQQGALVLEKTLVFEEMTQNLLIATSEHHSQVAIGRLRPTEQNTAWNRNGQIYRFLDLERGGAPVGEMFAAWGNQKKQFIYGPHGKYLIEISHEGGLQVYDAELKLDLGLLALDSGEVDFLRYASNGQLLSQDGNNIVKAWSLDFVDISPQFSSIENSIYAALIPTQTYALSATILPPKLQYNEPPLGAFFFTPDGYYSGDRSRLSELTVVNSSGLVNLDQYDVWVNRPDVTLGRLGLINETIGERLRSAVARRQKRFAVGSVQGVPFWLATPPKIALMPFNGQRFTDEPTLAVEIGVSTDEPIDRVILEVNGTPVRQLAGHQINGVTKVSVPLKTGPNALSARVTTQSGQTASAHRLSVTRTGKTPASRLFIFAAGVSDYRDSSLDLTYAAKDASDLTEYIARTTPNAIVKTALDGRADASLIDEAVRFFADAGPDDRAILFLSGHGFLDEELTYYFATHDFERSDPRRGGLSIQEIESVFLQSGVLNRAILIDSCHAGDFDEDLVDGVVSSSTSPITVTGRRGLGTVASDAPRPEAATAYSTMKSLFADLNTRSGAHIIASSGGLEYSVEGETWKNGVFTYALLEGLKSGNADLDRDGAIEIRELADYVGQSVSSLTQRGQTPSTRAINAFNNFAVAPAPR